MSQNLALNLTHTANLHGARTALRLDGRSLSFMALEDLSGRLATALRERGVEPGDRVGVMLPNVPEFAVAYYGILRAGGIVVPMNVLLKQREVAHYLEDSEAGLILAWHDFASEAAAGAADTGADCLVVRPGDFERLPAGVEPRRDVDDRAAGDTAVILYTSGTTGRPKGAELTHANLARNVEAVARMFDLSAESVILGALPLFHSFGQTCALNAAVASGACLTLIARFDPAKVLDVIERDRVTVFEGVPTMYAALLSHADRERFDTSSLRVCISGGAAMPVEVLRAFEEEFGCVILEGYGLSETSPAACFNHRDRPRKPGSIGTPIEGVAMRLVDDDGREVPAGQVGEVAIRGHNVMKGYWRRPEATAEVLSADGWFRTGDVGRVDEDGYFFIVDRKKELIIRGGYNVYPRELEEVLYEHPAVRECAVVGIPHPELGEEVGAAVALKDGASVTPAELQAYVKGNVAAYKYPRQVWLVDELPKGPTGKILKREIELPAGFGSTHQRHEESDMNSLTTSGLTTDLAELPNLIGARLGPTEWVEATQEQVNCFAELTGDRNFLHVDPERARSTPFGGTIAHGFLSLSMLAPVVQLLRVDDATMSVNYGLDKVRFPAPLRVGARWRSAAQIIDVVEIDGGVQATVVASAEIEGSTRPAVVAECLIRFYA